MCMCYGRFRSASLVQFNAFVVFLHGSRSFVAFSYGFVGSVLSVVEFNSVEFECI